MVFSAGDYIALGMFVVGAVGLAVREWRGYVNRETATATADANTNSIIGALTLKMNEMISTLQELERNRQKHELDCARYQERTAATIERTVVMLNSHDKSIETLKAQMAHVASGGAGKLREIG
jgi:hypothetical protein